MAETPSVKGASVFQVKYGGYLVRLAILIALFFTLGIVVLVGFLRLARELMLKDFFAPPSMPGETANQDQDQELDRGTATGSVNPTAR
jgi:hypothetical protein